MRKLIFKILTVLLFATFFQGLQAQTKQLPDGKISFQIEETQGIKTLTPMRNDAMVIGPDIYNQMGAISTDGTIVNISYTYAAFEQFTSFAADDITVPEGQTWEVKYARTTFYSTLPIENIASYSVIVYNDKGGKPDTVFIESTNNTTGHYESYAINASIYDVTAELNQSISLPAGKYWVCIQPITDIETENAYDQPGFWAANLFQDYGNAIGSQAEFKNPGGGYAAVYDWNNMTDYWVKIKGVDVGLYNLNFALFGPAKGNDIAVTEIVDPVNGENLSDAEIVKVKLQNHGTQNIANATYQMRFRVNGGVWSDFEEGTAITSGAEIIYTFHETADLSIQSAYTLEVEALFAADEYSANNVYSTTVENYGTIYNAEPNTRMVYTTCEGTFTDHGGLGDVYVGYSKDTVTFFPGTAGSRIRLEFQNTNMSGAYAFRFYNGSTTDAPHLGEWESLNGDEGVFTQEIPGLVIEGTNPEGAVTVIIPGFDTGSSTNNFLASVSCVKNEAVDFKVSDIEFNKPYSWETETIQLTATVQSRGLENTFPMVTFFANNTEIGSVSSTVLKYDESAKVTLDWTPSEAGTYTIRAELPEDNGMYVSDKVTSNTHEIYPMGALVEGFEGEQYPPDGWISKVSGGTNRLFIWYNSREDWEGKWQISIGNDTLVTPKLDIQTTDTLEFIYSAGFFGGTCTILYAPTPNGPWKVAHTVSYGLPYATKYKASLKNVKPAGAYYLAFKFQGGTMDFIHGVERYFNQSDLAIKSFDGPSDPQINIPVNYIVNVRNLGKGTLLATDYSVKLWKEINGVSTEISSQSGVAITLSNEHLFEFTTTFTTVETGAIYATVDYSADQDLLNNKSIERSLAVIKQGVEYVMVGSVEKAVSDYSAFAGYYGNYNESIFYKDSLNVKGEISGISVYYTSYSPVDYPLQVFMGETDNSTVDGGFLSTSTMVQVVNRTIKFGFTNSKYIQMYIPFDKPYLYSGEKNLIVALYEPPIQSNNYDDTYQGVYILSTEIGKNVMVYHPMQSHEKNVDVSDPVALNKIGGYVQTKVPLMTFYIKTAEMDASLAGTVTDEKNNLLEGALATLGGYANTTKTNAQGQYLYPVMPYGDVDITAKLFGFYDQTKTGILTAATQTVVDFKLESLSSESITGIVVGNDLLQPVSGVEITLKGYDLDYYTVTGADGTFTFEEVFAAKDYELTFVHSKYVTIIDTVYVPVGGLVMDSVVMDELETPTYNIFATLAETNVVNLSWQTPYTGTEGINDPTLGITDDYWWIYNSPDEDVQIGNLFRVSKPGTVTSIEISNWAWPGSQPSELFLRFYNKDQQEFMKPVSFMMPDSTVDWMQIDVPDFSYTEEFYVMIHWNKVHQSTPAIIGRPHDDNVGYLIDASGKWILLAEHPQLGAGYGGAVSLRANVLEDANKDSKLLNSYDLWRSELQGVLSGSGWSKLNSEPIPGTSGEVTYTDETFAQTNDGYYIYRVQAQYTNASSEYAYSNSINKGLFVSVTINVTANNGQNVDGARVIFANVNGADINKYEAVVSAGKVMFNSVLKGEYDIIVTNGAAYEVYENSVTISAISVLDVEMIEFVFTPTNLVIVPMESEKKAEFNWAIGNNTTYQADDGSFEQALNIDLGGSAELGNYFEEYEGGQIYSVDIQGAANDMGGKVSLVFYNNNKVLIGQTDKFVLQKDSLLSVSVNNIAYKGPFFAMVKFYGDETEPTPGIAMDTDSDPGVAYYNDAENGFVRLADWGYYGNFVIRVHALVSSKKSTILATEIKETNTLVSKPETLKMVSENMGIVKSGIKSVLSYNIFLDNMTTPVAEGVTSQLFTFTEAEHLKVEGLHKYKAGVQAVFATGSSIVVPIEFDYNRPVGVLETMDSKLTMYPNPTADVVTFTNAQNSQISIYSSIGELVKVIEVNSQTIAVPVSDLPSGAFIVKITVAEGSIYRNLVITR